ncbi:Collagen alpha-1(XXVII) chain A [Bienertia sinuspersici]
MDEVTLRYWHGGVFGSDKQGNLVYMGGESRTFTVDADELCFWDLEDMGKKCGGYDKILGIFYLVPGLSLYNGLRRVVADKEVLEMGELVRKFRCIEVYVWHRGSLPELEPTDPPTTQTSFQPFSENIKKKPLEKLKPRKGPTKQPTTPSVIHLRCSPRNITKTPQQDASLRSSPTNKAKNSQEVALTKQPTIIPNPNSSFATTNNPEKGATKPTDLPQKGATKPTDLLEKGATEPESEFLASYEWEDPRPDSPIPLKDLLNYPSDESDTSDPDFELSPTDDEDDELREDDDEYATDEDEEGQDADIHYENEVIAHDIADEVYESENSDDEVKVARDRVRVCNTKLVEIAQQLQLKAAEGRLVPQLQQTGEGSAQQQGEHCLSEYEDSQDDIHTPPDSGDEEVSLGSKKRGQIVSLDQDFTNFKWVVGQRFPSRAKFKEAVAKYAIFQGRNVSVVLSNWKRKQQIGIKCLKDCPFYLYAAWDTRRATLVVRTVNDMHTCSRNMKKNRQLKCSWVARQLLDVFKARPHWPAKEIQETVRRGFKVVINRDFAYKVKYAAHKMLHGSMHDHYKKIKPYLEV